MKKVIFILLTCLFSVSCVNFPTADHFQNVCVPRYDIPTPKESVLYLPPITVKRNIIQITDDGELVNRCGWTDVIKSLDRQNEKNRAQVVILYIHGWKHNANIDDENLHLFDKLLTQIGEDERKKDSQRNVIGIYVGWNGKSTDIPVVKEFSFWGRKRAADDISQSAVLTKLIGTINNILNIRKNTHDRTIYLGHSFGARILYSATSQLLIYNSMMAYPEKGWGSYKEVKGTNGTIVLVNPAFEASLFTVFNSLRRNTESFHENQKPLLISISADNDWATRYAFPIGQKFGLQFNHRATTTLGNYEEYRTHKLLKRKDNGLDSGNKKEKWFDNFCNNDVCLARELNNSVSNGNPFIVATADANIVNGHNGIWEEVFVNWLAKFINEINKTK